MPGANCSLVTASLNTDFFSEALGMAVSISIVPSMDRHHTSIKIGLCLHSQPRATSQTVTAPPHQCYTKKTAPHFQFLKEVPLYLHLLIEYSQWDISIIKNLILVPIWFLNFPEFIVFFFPATYGSYMPPYLCVPVSCMPSGQTEKQTWISHDELVVM